MRYEILDEVGNVVNVINVLDTNFLTSQYPNGNYRHVEEPPVTDDPSAWRVSKGKFRLRFTPTERVRIEMASLDDPSATMTQRQQAAAIRVALADQRDAEYIDLKYQPTRDGVANMESFGLLDFVGRATIILDTQPTEIELYRG